LPYLKGRIYQPYLSPRLTRRERVDRLMMHYRLVLDMGLAGLVRRSCRQPVPVADLTGRSGSRYQLLFGSMDSASQDGEMTLKLKCGIHTIYTAAFNLIEEHGLKAIEVGGLHGFLTVDKTFSIKSITRDLFGYKPRDLMIDAVNQIASALQCRHIILLSNANKLAASGRFCRKSADYDRLWSERGAFKRNDGNFQLASTSLSVSRSAAGASVCAGRKESLMQKLVAQIQVFLHTERGLHTRSAATR
ncbi:MAG: hypothetical protein K0S28_1424, partial [Paucimonas sp.]|nr:hypothetical protein [Paucimonas sp.]